MYPEPSENYLTFNQIPSFFYDASLSGLEWEEKLVEFLIETSKKKNTTVQSPHSNDIILEDSHDYNGRYEENLKMTEPSTKPINKTREEEITDLFDRKLHDYDLRAFLYSKDVPIPTNEMSREYYLRTRLSKDERLNLVNIINGFSQFMSRNKRNITYAVFGIGTSTYSDEYFDKLKNKFINNEIDLDSKIIEKAESIAEQGIHFYDWQKYVEWCFNESPAFDEKTRPVSEKKFYEHLGNEQERYSTVKSLSDILNNKGEDLDFAICLDEYPHATHPILDYNDEKNEVDDWNRRSIKMLKMHFIQFLNKEKYFFKEEIEMLSNAEYHIALDGTIERQKNILPHTFRVSTLRVFPEIGREMHFYFYNEMADMKVKNERINNESFVQILRYLPPSIAPSYGPTSDLQAAIDNGEKTGEFENPALLAFLKDTY
ncbi:MAG: hypothetical protein ACP5N2_00845 [Candidatus Nanoarchaeia archaeon]